MNYSLTKHVHCFIDREDFKRLSKHHWRASFSGLAFYAKGKVDGKDTYMHRFIMRARRGQLIDHINGNTLDNRKKNLRRANKSINALNSKISKQNTSGYKGISWFKRYQKWEVYISVKGKRKHLGYYKTLDRAIEIRDKAVAKHHRHLSKRKG